MPELSVESAGVSEGGEDERVENSAPLQKTELKKPAARLRGLSDLERDRMRVSTNNERVRTITQKLSKLQQGIQADKSRARSLYESRVKELDKKLTVHAEQTEEKLCETESQMDSIIEALGQERLARELLDERKSGEIELKSQQIKLEVEHTLQEYKQTLTDVKEQVGNLLEQLDAERKQRVKSEQEFGVELRDKVARLSDEIEAQTKENSELVDTVRSLEAKLEETSKKLRDETELRLELRSFVDTAMDDLTKRVQTELAAERDDRETMEETLLKLIEETCTRVENGLTSQE